MTLLRDLVLSRGPAPSFAAMGLFWGAFAALVPEIKPKAGLSDGGFGLAMLVAACGAVMAMWLAPLAEARMGRHALPVATLAMAAAFLLPGLTTVGVAFALSMTLASMASGTLDVVMNARVAAVEAGARRSLMNLNHAVFSVGYAFAAITAGLMREAQIPPALVLACMSALTVGLVWIGLGGWVPDPEAEDSTSGAPPLSWALLLPGGAIILIAFLVEQATEGWSALHLERNMGAGAAQGALGPALLGITMAIGRLSGQAMAQRFTEASVISCAATLSAAGAITAALADGLALAYSGFAVLGLGVSVVAPMAFAWIGRLVPARHRTHAIARISVVGYAGFFIGPPMMGFLSEGFGLQASFSAVSLLLLVVPLALVPLLARRTMA
ncbi:MFS transporter [Thalassococcus sp. BH17M4-6]|uniref:MFS transporter n=1 Tax=Thalassococcus sp. BH17M4-6 TaxID=3413148 RepID=UPI003BC175B7